MASAAAKHNPAKESLRQEQREQKAEKRKKGKDGDLSDALKDTFPASDPVASQTATKPGSKSK